MALPTICEETWLQASHQVRRFQQLQVHCIQSIGKFGEVFLELLKLFFAAISVSLKKASIAPSTVFTKTKIVFSETFVFLVDFENGFILIFLDFHVVLSLPLLLAHCVFDSKKMPEILSVLSFRIVFLDCKSFSSFLTVISSWRLKTRTDRLTFMVWCTVNVCATRFFFKKFCFPWWWEISDYYIFVLWSQFKFLYF